jgi:hypothetical protein
MREVETKRRIRVAQPHARLSRIFVREFDADSGPPEISSDDIPQNAARRHETGAIAREHQSFCARPFVL